MLYCLEIQLVVCELKIERMDSNSKQGYKPPPEFQVEAKEPLIDLSSTDSTELWLIQWPKNKEVSFIIQYLLAQFVSIKTSFRYKKKNIMQVL